MSNGLVWVAAFALLLAACGDDDGGGGGSLTDRCNDWCAERNAEDDCGADINCSASCAGLVANATSTGCENELDAFFTCSQGDVCTAGGGLVCNDENTALIVCETPDGGP